MAVDRENSSLRAVFKLGLRLLIFLGGLYLIVNTLQVPRSAELDFTAFVVGTLMAAYPTGAAAWWLIHTRTCAWCQKSSAKSGF